MGIEINRRNVSAFAKLLGRKDLAELGHSQRLDVVAQALGFESHAALMGKLKSLEGAAEPAQEPFTVITAIDYGFNTVLTSAISGFDTVPENHEGSVIERTFATQAELEAYDQGIEDMQDAISVEGIACNGSGPLRSNIEFFEARWSEPGLDPIDWHNRKVAEFDPSLED